MAVTYIGSYSLGDINTMLSGTVLPELQNIVLYVGALLASVLVLLDGVSAVIKGAFGLEALKAALQVQLGVLSGAIGNFQLAIGDPLAYFTALLNGIADLIARLKALLASGPDMTLSLKAQLSADIGLAASLKAQIAGIQALIEAQLALVGPVLAAKAQVDALLLAIGVTIADLIAALSATGGIHLFRLEGAAAAVAAELSTAWGANFGINATAQIKTIMVVVESSVNASAFATLGTLIKTSDSAETPF